MTMNKQEWEEEYIETLELRDKMAAMATNAQSLDTFIKQLDRKLDQLRKEGTVMEEESCGSDDT